MTDADPGNIPQRLSELANGLRQVTEELQEVRAESRAEVDQVSGRLDLLWAVDPNNPDQHTGVLSDLIETLSALAAQVERLTADPPALRFRVPCWTQLSALAAEQAWQNLLVWVRDVLLVRYPIETAKLPTCWYRHPAAVEELSWLHQAWRAAYEKPDAPPKEAGEWHDKWLPGVLKRLPGEYIKCRTDHQDEPFRRTHPFVDDPDGLDAYIRQELAARPAEAPEQRHVA
jgi:hypothetical protein